MKARPGLTWWMGWRAFFAPADRSTSRFLLSGSLAMALGLVPLVVVLSIADGMIDSITTRTVETSLYRYQVWSLQTPLAIETTRSTIHRALTRISTLRGPWPEQQGFGMAYAGADRRLGLELRGIDSRWAQDPAVSPLLKAMEGKLTFPDPNTVWIGQEAAQKLGVRVGDSLKILTTRTRSTLTLPRVTTVQIGAIVSVGYQELDRLWLFASLELTGQILDSVQSPVFWGISSSSSLNQTNQELERLRNALGSGWQTFSWQTTGRSQFLNYQATRTLLATVMALVLLVASVNVSTAMVMTVSERKRETAILKALGATPRWIERRFLVLGLGAGVSGTLVGLVAGVAIAELLDPLVHGLDVVINVFTGASSFHLLDSSYYLQTIPVKLDPVVLGLSGIGAVVLAVLSCWWPARRASRERPLETLRRS